MEINLEHYRDEINQIDDQIIALFVQRMHLSAQIGAYKRSQGLPILDSGRERQIMNRVTLAAGEDLEHYAKLLYQTVFDVSKAYQGEAAAAATPLAQLLDRLAAGVQPHLPNRALVACQGTEGAYSQQACRRMFEFPDILFMNTFSDVFNAVEKGMCPYGVLPIENSTAGSVSQVYGLMEKHRFFIVRAARQRIEHRLLALPGTKLSDIREVVSHEQALRQCGAFLSAHPGISAVSMANTAVAAARVASSGRRDIAAIASRDCEALYGLESIAENVSDSGNNFTRFICIAKDPALYEGANKISLMLSAAHKPGSLFRLISRIAVSEVNLSKLESRPIPGEDFEFRFFFDIEASIRDEKIRALSRQLKNEADQFVFLGNYEEIR